MRERSTTTPRRSHLESSALAEDARRIILHHVSLVDMLSIHCVSPAWRRRGLLDPRWVPAVAPPCLRAAGALTSRDHGAALARYFVRYVKWVRDWLADADDVDARRRRRSALDGFFALAPWAGGPRGPWLARALAPRDAPKPERRSPRLAPRTADELPCTYFQRRDEIEDDLEPSPGAAVPILLARAGAPESAIDATARAAARRPARRLRRVSLEPVAVVARGTWPQGSVPQMRDVAEASRFLDAARRVVDCYLGAGAAAVKPVRTKEVADSKGMFRKIRSEFFMFGHDLGLNAVALDEHGARDMAVYAVAPHLFFDDARLFATPDSEADERLFAAPVRATVHVAEDHFLDEQHVPYCVSTGAVHFFNDAKMRSRAFAATALQAALRGGAGLSACENWNCALNRISCFGDLAAHSLLCCPCCFRRLELAGVVGDVDAVLRRLAVLLASDDFRTVSARDLRELGQYGYVDEPPATAGPVVVDLT